MRPMRDVSAGVTKQNPLPTAGRSVRPMRDVFALLFQRAEDRLTPDDHAALAHLTRLAHDEARQVVDTCEKLSALLRADADFSTFPERQDADDLLCALARGLNSLAGTIHIPTIERRSGQGRRQAERNQEGQP